MLICIHGGGWHFGKHQDMHRFIRGAAERGYVAISPSYRFAPAFKWPAQRDDMRAVLAWMQANAEKYGLDLARVGATGFSAGGHLALVLGTLAESSTGERRPIQAVVNYFGPTDLTSDFFPDTEGEMLNNLLGVTRTQNIETYRDVSPMHHLDSGDAPVLTLHGSEDEVVSVEQARVFHKALDAARVPNRLHILEGRKHGWRGADMHRSFEMTMNYFDVHLRAGSKIGKGNPLLLSENFDRETDRWTPTDARAWKIESVDKDPCFVLFRDSDYKPPVRSPRNIAILDESLTVGDFVLDVKLQSTKQMYDHLDLCLFFGYEAPDRFYYVHLGKRADPHAHSIFLVNRKPRVSIAKERTDGTPWDQGWHHVRVRRETQSGLIEVFWDDMEKPVMRAQDRTFLSGRVGLGSFDDTGRFDDIRLWGQKTPKAAK